MNTRKCISPAQSHNVIRISLRVRTFRERSDDLPCPVIHVHAKLQNKRNKGSRQERIDQDILFAQQCTSQGGATYGARRRRKLAHCIRSLGCPVLLQVQLSRTCIELYNERHELGYVLLSQWEDG